MRKVHLISVTEPLVLDLALALREKGYEVSASGCGLTEEMIGRLHNAGCTCYGDGWFPEKLIKDIHSVVLGAKVKKPRQMRIGIKELIQKLFLMQWDMEEVTISIVVTN